MSILRSKEEPRKIDGRIDSAHWRESDNLDLRTLTRFLKQFPSVSPLTYCSTKSQFSAPAFGTGYTCVRYLVDLGSNDFD